MKNIFSLLILIIFFFTACNKQPIARCANDLKIDGKNVEDCDCKSGYSAKFDNEATQNKNFKGFDCDQITKSELKNYNSSYLVSFLYVNEPINKMIDDIRFSYHTMNIHCTDTAWHNVPWSLIYTKNTYIEVRNVYNRMYERYNNIGIYMKNLKYSTISIDSVHIDLRPLGKYGYSNKGEGIFLAYKQIEDDSLPGEVSTSYENFTLCLTTPGDSTSFEAIRKIPIEDF